MTCDLIVIGASVRAAAQSALRAGFRPYAIDQFADRDLAAICPAVKIGNYPRDLAAALRNAPQAPWMYTGGLENVPRLVDRMAQLRPLWGNPGSVLRPVRDPWKLAEVAREAGLEMPPIVRELPRQWQSDRWLHKPLRSSGGYQVELAAGPRQPQRRGYYYQQFVPGQGHGALFLASDKGCHLLGITRQIQTSDSFRYEGSIAAPDVRDRCSAALLRLGQTLTDRFALRGLFNVDFIANDAGCWPLEVNPRYSASVELLERAGGISYVALHAAVFRREAIFLPANPGTSRVYGKAVVYAPMDGIVTATIDELVTEWNSGSDWPGIADVPRVAETINAGQPICTVFADGESVERVNRQLEERSQRILNSAILESPRR